MIQVNSVSQPYTITTSDIASKNAIAATGNFSNVVNNKLQAPQTMEDIFQNASRKYGVPINLLKAVAKAESDFNPKAVSKAGAQGVMQLMPGTARELGVTDSFDPEQNIMGGAKYLRSMLDKYDGDAKLALAAYNAGANNVDKYNGIPPFKETQNYVVKVMEYAGRDLQLPSYSSSSYGFQTTKAGSDAFQAASSATSSYAQAYAWGGGQTAFGMPAYGYYPTSGNPYAGMGMDSQTAGMYQNLYNSMQQFQTYTKDDYLFYLEQLKMSMNPAKILNDTGKDSWNSYNNYMLQSRMPFV